MSALSTALMLAPTAIKLGNQIFGGGSKPSDYEKRLMRMADIFEQDANAPITENREFLSGKTMIDERDRDNRKMIDNKSAITGGTDEAKLATIDGSNRSYNRSLNSLLNSASQFRDRSRSQSLNVLGMAEGAKQNRVANYSNNLSRILDPLSEAGKAFAMADLFAEDSTTGSPGFGTWGDGSNKGLFPKGFSGGSTRRLFSGGRS